MRTSRIAAPLILLAACSQPASREAQPGEELIECALHGAAAYARVCAVERSGSKGMATLIFHHPDGGFRRFDVLPDGAGVSAADGADSAVQRLRAALLEISVGDDRYRLPVMTGGNAPAN